MNTCDAAVVGLGVSGAAITRELARRGWRVLAFDRHSPPHTLGSSHGLSRVIRTAYYENPLYVPLALRAFELWHELSDAAGTALFRMTGVLNIGAPDGALVQGTLASVHTHGLPHEWLDSAALRARYPGFVLPDESVAVLERAAGMLAVEPCVDALLREATHHGATLHFDEPVLDWTEAGRAIRLRSAAREVSCGALILAAGPWLPELLGPAWTGPPLAVERQVIGFFAPQRDAAAVSANACPIALWEYAPGRLFYTLPDAGDGVKAAFHHGGGITDPHRVERIAGDDEVAAIRARLAAFQPAAAGPLRQTGICLYTNTPDLHFLIDAHPQAERTFIVSACSGHGFKFAPAIAQSLVSLLETGRLPAALRPFGMDRFR